MAFPIKKLLEMTPEERRKFLDSYRTPGPSRAELFEQEQDRIYEGLGELVEEHPIVGPRSFR